MRVGCWQALFHEHLVFLYVLQARHRGPFVLGYLFKEDRNSVFLWSKGQLGRPTLTKDVVSQSSGVSPVTQSAVHLGDTWPWSCHPGGGNLEDWGER